MDRGIKGSGQGFDAKSMGRIGAYGFIPTHNMPEHQRRDAMLKVQASRRPLPLTLASMLKFFQYSKSPCCSPPGVEANSAAPWLMLNSQRRHGPLAFL